LLSEKDKEKFEPLEHFKLGVALTLCVGYFDKDREKLINESYAYRLLKRIVIKLLLDSKLEAIQTFINIVLNLFVTNHMQQILQKLAQVYYQILLQHYLDPFDQVPSHLEV